MQAISKKYLNTPDMKVVMQYGGKEVEITELSVLLIKTGRSQDWVFSGILRVENFYSKKVQAIATERFRLLVLDKSRDLVLLETHPIEIIHITKPSEEGLFGVTFGSETPKSIELTEAETKLYRAPKKKGAKNV